MIFSVAKFNNGDKVHDTQIVTSIGNNIVTWRLKDIKNGDLGKYEIKAKSVKVVDSQFMFDDDREILVTMQN